MADPIWLKDVLVAAGMTVEELEGARQRGHGDFGSIWGCVDHHTGSSGNSSPWGIANHPELQLCSQLFLTRAGKYWVCGVGVAWHAGAGAWKGIDRNNANQVTIGTEADNNGTEGWVPKQYWPYVIGQAAILNKLGHDHTHSIGHKEWAGPAQGKWDPGGMNMDKFRDDIRINQIRLRGGPVQVIPNLINRLQSFSPWLGKRLDLAEQPTRGVPGKFVRYENGVIYFDPKDGSCVPVPKYLLEVYARFDYERGLLGLPAVFHAFARDPKGLVTIGEVQGFDGGAIYRKYGSKGFVVHGEIGKRWFRNEGAEKGHLGWPTSDEYKSGASIVQDFEFGQLIYAGGKVSLDKGGNLFVPAGR